MPLINPVIIGGKVVGAYVDETYAIDGQGTATTTELLQYILNVLNEGGSLGAVNGLNIFENNVYLGGTLIEDTNIINLNRYIKIGRDTAGNKSYITQDSVQKRIDIVTSDAVNSQALICLPAGYSVQVKTISTNVGGTLGVGPNESSIGVGTLGNAYDSGFTALLTQAKIKGVRTYANDAAAQADATLDVNGLYRLNADPVLRIKI